MEQDHVISWLPEPNQTCPIRTRGQPDHAAKPEYAAVQNTGPTRARGQQENVRRTNQVLR
jgi:hypothetical protein